MVCELVKRVTTMKRRWIILLSILAMIASMFVPIFDVILYNYGQAENELQSIVKEYARTNYQSDVSLMSYRQTTGGPCWAIKYSTNDELVGSVIPIWVVNPGHLKNEGNYGESTFLYREIIVFTKKDGTVYNVSYDGENISVIIPKKIIVAMPKNEYTVYKSTYKVYDLSVIGIVLLYIKTYLCICIGLLIARCMSVCFRTIQSRM